MGQYVGPMRDRSVSDCLCARRALAVIFQRGQLHGKIAKRRALDRAAEDVESGSLLRQFVEQNIFTATADDVEALKMFLRQRFCLMQNGRVARSKAVQNHPGHRGRGLQQFRRDAAIPLRELCNDAFGHLSGRKQAGIIHVEQQMAE